MSGGNPSMDGGQNKMDFVKQNHGYLHNTTCSATHTTTVGENPLLKIPLEVFTFSMHGNIIMNE